MPECAKTHLQQSRISKFSGGGPRTPLFKGRGGKGLEEREGKRKEGERGRIGKGGTGRDRGGKEGRNVGGDGRGARHGLRLPRDKLWIRPWITRAAEVQYALKFVNELLVAASEKAVDRRTLLCHACSLIVFIDWTQFT